MPPLYEYVCNSCQASFEERVSSHASEAPACPKCGKNEAKKLISRFAVGGQGDLRESTFHGCHGPGPDSGDGHGGCGSCD